MNANGGGTVPGEGGRVALVTGGAGGLGRAWCRRLADAGFTVYLGARTLAAAREAARELPGVRALALDVTRERSLARAFEGIRVEAGRLDWLVNNAARAPGPRESAMLLDPQLGDRKALRDSLDANAISPLRMAATFLPLLRHGVAPTIVNVASDLALASRRFASRPVAYAMGKAALVMVNACIAESLQGTGVRAVAVHPGWVRTAMGGSHAPLEARDAVAMLYEMLEREGMAVDGAFVDARGRRLDAAG